MTASPSHEVAGSALSRPEWPGLTDLMWAVYRSDVEAVRERLLQSDALDILAGEWHEDRTALTFAAEVGDFECLDLLLGALGAHTTDLVAAPALHDALRWAAGGGHVKCVERLLAAMLRSESTGCPEAQKRAPFSRYPGPDGVQRRAWPLQWAAAGGHVECVDRLLTALSPINSEEFYLGLEEAMANGQTVCVERILREEPAEPETLEKWQDMAYLVIVEPAVGINGEALYPRQPLSLGHAACLRLLARYAGSAYQTDALGQAARDGNIDRIDALMPQDDQKWSDDARAQALNVAIIEAVSGAEPAALDHLLSLRERVPQRPFPLGQDPLITAARGGCLECLCLLLGVADARAREEDGTTALMAAALNGHYDCVLALLPYSDASAVDEQGRTALMAAACRGDFECLGALLPVSDPNAVDSGGWSALAEAAYDMTYADKPGARECVLALLPATSNLAIEHLIHFDLPDGYRHAWLVQAIHDERFARAQRERHALLVAANSADSPRPSSTEPRARDESVSAKSDSAPRRSPRL